ncbi:hypothetical protein BJ508DRAFT_157091 [Ascobolus immersus RN42]|uniref:F-box domain-containing protein n=1 Tax=Ascobolus immersus RN42 TaxID=1160509 RepID=A0A3N4I0Q2_ASCIM|nr:hypothetical protein BJ508DRAFT_157091 [Ascobolus immersus RN42]
MNTSFEFAVHQLPITRSPGELGPSLKDEVETIGTGPNTGPRSRSPKGFLSLPLELHYEISLYIPYTTIVALTQTSTTLRSLYINSHSNLANPFLTLPLEVHARIALLLPELHTRATISCRATPGHHRQLAILTRLCKGSYEIYNRLLPRVFGLNINMALVRGYTEPDHCLPGPKQLRRIFEACGWMQSHSINYACWYLRMLCRVSNERCGSETSAELGADVNAGTVSDDGVFTMPAILQQANYMPPGIVRALLERELHSTIHDQFRRLGGNLKFFRAVTKYGFWSSESVV